MALVVTIAGVPVSVQPDWSIMATANGRDVFTCEVVSADGSYRPAKSAEIIAELDGTRVYGGFVQTPTERGLGGRGVQPIVTKISAIDFNSLVDRRYITATIHAGTLKAALLVLEPYLTTYGVTLDAAQVDGPNLPELVYTRRKAADVFTELATLSGYLWEIDYSKVLRMYAPGTLTAPFNITQGDGNTIGDVIIETTDAAHGAVYANRVVVVAGTPEVPIEVQADDLAEQAAHGLWEIVISAPTVFDEVTAQALADAYLLQRTPTPKRLKYVTPTAGLKPGQTQTLDFAWRNFTNVCILTDVRIYTVKNLVRYAVTALEGSIFQPGWRNLYQQWLQPLTQVAIVPGTAGGGRTVFYLGGSSTLYVESSTPDWIPIDGTAADPGLQVTLDTAARGSTAATVVVRLRATAGGVTARLRNVTDGVTVGTSAQVNSATFQMVTFPVTLTSGSKIYQIELLPTLADTPVAGIAYLE